MRPVRLEMEGFASFRAPTTVDFEGTDYFALIGPTGSGKSTVIDAMVFALYGSAPRWGRSNSVQYALAPTTTRATVRLVFDVGEQRYQVAREVRRSGQSIQQKSAVLERFDDPSQATATTETTDVLASEVRDVTPAVETLLGLSFDDFTKAVVLPQGRFAEFLNATVGDRQDILLKLLGAHQYDIVMRAASARRSTADTAVARLEARLGDLGAATPEAAQAAASRVEELRLLRERTDTLITALDRARAEAHETAAAATQAQDTVERLLAVRIPAGITDLAQRADAVRAEVEASQATARRREADYDRARGHLMDAGERTPLERQRDQWAEVAELSAALPSVEAESQTAGLRDTEAAQAKARAEVAWADAFAVQTAARGDIDAAEAAEDTLLTRRQAIAALVPPVGLTDLAERLDGATRAQDEAATALASAERAEDAARHLAQEAGDPVTWTADLNRYESALTLDVKIAELNLRGVTAAQALEAAHRQVDACEAEVESAHRRAAQMRDVATAAGLRAGLQVGHACPVCTAPVATLPAPLDAAASDLAEKEVQRAELAAQNARIAVGRADADVSGQARSLAEAREQRTSLLTDDADAALLRDEAAALLTAIERARRAVTDAEATRRGARAVLDSARERAAAVEAERHDAEAALGQARSGLLAYGAPVTGPASLQGAWDALLAWATGALADLDQAALPQARDARRAAQSAAEEAQEAFADATRTRATSAENARAAEAAAVTAAAALAETRRRMTRLHDALQSAPSAQEVAEALERLDVAEQAEKAAYVVSQESAAARERALQRERLLHDELAAADRLLRETREPLVAWGAPAVDTSDLPASWSALVAWAGEATVTAGEAAADARARAERADLKVGVAAQALVDEARTGGVAADSSAQVPAALTAAATRAADLLERINADLERVATLRRERDEAQERRQVAGLLAEHLNAKKFQRWLAGAALDVLVEAASASLLELSGGQFTLAHEKGEFHVIDHADAEARRSVRTLSGGETFQASLALALALSAELSTMSSTAARLDSIFLDEGFGSLDPDSLEVVAATLERLAQGDRLVGVVTHVQGLAERIPTRFTVARSSRTSTVVREG